ncbi:hypothetical protein HK105_207907 [Polyrhizophydium stewartii]|uniref:Copper acquisition factor BIM1-like domain-containing protein n=1 Tax=Polyrhizophydium stewartii TaxID=2732419 RepID=A0ABR4MZE3_9FUNG
MHSPLSLTSALVAAAAAHAVSAHFILTSPPSRGFDELIESQAPCGGFNTTSATRTTVNTLTTLNLTIADRGSQLVVKFGTGDNPTSFPVQVASAGWSDTGIFPIQISLAPTNITSPVNGTIQIVLTSKDGVLYQCADVHYVPSPVSTSSIPVPPPGGTSLPAVIDPKQGGKNAAAGGRTATGTALVLLSLLVPLFL